MATCPHGCIRCRVIEAGLDPSHGLSQKQFAEVFGVVEQERERAPLAEDTLEAISAEGDARAALAQAEADVNAVISAKVRKGPEFEEALRAATDERKDAGEHHHAARLRMRALIGRDQEVWRAEQQAAARREREEQQAAERAEARKRGRRLLGRFRS